MNDIKEICFYKKLECCFFSLGMFLKEGNYYIYTTTQKPNVDLSNRHIGDFSVFEEVRYNNPVCAICIGKLNISNMIVNQIYSAYLDIVASDDINIQKIIARDWLVSYKEMSNYIENI